MSPQRTNAKKSKLLNDPRVQIIQNLQIGSEGANELRKVLNETSVSSLLEKSATVKRSPRRFLRASAHFAHACAPASPSCFPAMLMLASPVCAHLNAALQAVAISTHTGAGVRNEIAVHKTFEQIL